MLYSAIMKREFVLSFPTEFPDGNGDLITKECLQSMVETAEGVQIFSKDAFEGEPVGSITSARMETDSVVKFEAEMSDDF